MFTVQGHKGQKAVTVPVTTRGRVSSQMRQTLASSAGFRSSTVSLAKIKPQKREYVRLRAARPW